MPTMRFPTWLAGALTLGALSLPAVAAEQPLFTLTDPAGDDHGDGSLVYPLREDMQPGDLDIVRLEAFAEGDGTRFEATFARNIRVPDSHAIDALGTQLNSVAKLGFYTFNIDIYIDVDRVPGSGSTESLPGRRVAISPATAWEKVICLTPRPFEAKDVLRALEMKSAKADLRGKNKRGVSTEDIKMAKEYVGQDLDAKYFFPTRVRVLGRKVSFFVPGAFLGGQAKATWAYTVAVSGADLANKLDVKGLFTSGAAVPPEAARMMLLPVAPGKSAEYFGNGREDDDLQPPLVDIIVPAGQKQEDVLRDYDLQANRPVTLTGVVPTNK